MLYYIVPKVDVEVKLADSSYSGVVDLVLDGFQTSILSTDGVVSYKVLYVEHYIFLLVDHSGKY